MALRDLVMGGGACVVPDPSGASSSSNPLGGFADSMLGSASKTQEKLQELPGLENAGPSLSEFGGESLASLPGSEFATADGQHRASDFGRRWGAGPPTAAPAFDQMTQKLAGAYTQQPLNMNDPPQRVLSGLLQSFLHSSRVEAPFHAVPLPELGLSQADKRRIRDRSSIMSRHMFAERGDEYVDAQVNALLQSLDIENNLMLPQPMGGRLPQFEDLWNETQRPRLRGPDVTDQWAQEFSQHDERGSRPGQWAEEFNHQYGGVSGPGRVWAEEYHARSNPDAWADQFGQYQHEVAVRAPHGGQALGHGDALEETRSLVQTLSQNQDPKFQNSKFLQFVSKMSRGELIVEDNQVRSSVANGWANDFERQHQPLGHSWASDFTREHQHRGDRWADEFAQSQRAPLTSDDLVKDFTRLQVNDWADEFGQTKAAPSTSEEWVKDFTRTQVQDWADEFSEQIAKNPYGDGSHESWLDSYDKFVEQQVAGEFKTGSSKWVYVFADHNPYVGHPNPLKEGQELFRRGLLSEAVLALEAEVLKNPENAQGWRVLGITHAENDDDRQAIASMMRARDADPTNLEVLLALGVGHTNELEQQEALHYLRGWLQNHPRYGKLVPPDPNQPVNHVEVVRMVNEAVLMSPEDGDVHTVLGVLYNLSREYDRAIGSFQTALQLKPRDYSLWNKLGATQANSSRSVDAIAAYQQALDLKPNYVRAWSNMGIGFANQGLYDASIRYYVRALSMNPRADNVWDYLRISMSSTGASRDVLLACENRQLDVLQKEFPL